MRHPLYASALLVACMASSQHAAAQQLPPEAPPEAAAEQAALPPPPPAVYGQSMAPGYGPPSPAYGPPMWQLSDPCAQTCRESQRCYFNAERGRCDDGMQRYSTGLMVGGIVTTSIGGVMLASAAMTALLDGAFDGGRGVDTEEAAVLIAGGAMVLGGIPMIVVGASKERRWDAAALAITVGPGSGAVQLSF